MKYCFLFLLLLCLQESIFTQTYDLSNDTLKNGYYKYTSKDYDDAISDFSNYIRKNKPYDIAYYLRGMCYKERAYSYITENDSAKIQKKIANYSLAIDDFSKAININPEFSSAYYQRGIARLYLNSYYNQQKEVLRLYKNDYKVCKDLQISKDLGFSNNTEWEQYCDTSIINKLDYYYSAYNKYKLKNYMGAIDEINHFISFMPDNYLGYNLLASINGDLQNYNEAIKQINKVIELVPDFATAYDNIGYYYLYLDKYDKAIENFDKCVQLNNKNWDALLGLEITFFKKDDLEKVIKYHKLAISAEPRLRYGMNGINLLEKEGYSYNMNSKKVIKKIFEFIDEKRLKEALNSYNDTIIKQINNGYKVNTVINEGKSLLIVYSELGILEMVTFLVDHGANINYKDSLGRTALIHACIKSQNEVINYLVKKGADVNSKETNGTTALMHAASFENLEAVQLLISKGADINVKNSIANTALMFAVKSGNYEIVKYLIEMGGDIKVRDFNGTSLLLHAISRDNINPLLVKYLIEKGADIYQTDIGGDNAFIRSILQMNIDIIKLLVSKGININYEFKKNNIFNFMISDYGEVVSNWGVYDSTIVHANLNSDNFTDIIKFLIDNGLDVNIHDEKSRTLLMHAVINGNVELTKFMLSRKADLTKKSAENYDALAYSIINNNYEIIKLLVEQGADLNTRYSSDVTPLILLAASNQYKYIPYLKKCNELKYLVLKGADVNLQDGNGNTPLIILLDHYRDDTDIIKLLTTPKNINMITLNNGATPLHYAVSSNLYYATEYLIKTGADINRQSDTGLTVLMTAVSSKNKKIVELLLNNGIDKNLKDNKGRTATDYTDDDEIKLLLK